MKLKSAYDNFDEESTASGLECKDESLTQQHDEADANINNIVRKYMQTGQIEQHKLPPLEGDFSNAPDMQTAMNLQLEAKQAFMEHPAEVRSRFNNDPAAFVAFCSDENNIEDMQKLGLLNEEANKRRVALAASEKIRREKDREDAEAFRKAQKAQQ